MTHDSRGSIEPTGSSTVWSTYTIPLRGTRWIRPKLPRVVLAKVGRRMLPSAFLPRIPAGLRLHVGCGSTHLDGYVNVDAYAEGERPSEFKVDADRFARAETLDREFGRGSVSEIRCHHMLEHVGLLDLDRTLRGWNQIMMKGSLLWVEVPDFEGCARAILHPGRHPERSEVFWRHLFGSQTARGEIHQSGFTAQRLIWLLEKYGFDVHIAYVRKVRRSRQYPEFNYPSNLPLPDLTVMATKVRAPDEAFLRSNWTFIKYRRLHPNPDLASD